MTAQCLNCWKPLGDQATLCRDCQDGLVEQLQHVRWLLRELQTTATGQAVLEVVGGPSGEPVDPADDQYPLAIAETKIPFNGHASAVFHSLRNTVTTWARVYGCQDGKPDVYLLGHVRVIRMSETAGELTGDLDRWWKRGLQVINRPDDRVWLGFCSANGGQCMTPLYAKVGRPQVKCWDCRTIHDVQERRGRLLEALDDYLERPPVVARLLVDYDPGLQYQPVYDRIRQWLHRGKLGLRDGGTVRIGDVRNLLAVGQNGANADDMPKDAA